MKLKTLLAGSTAALVSASGAYAADPVLAEPEPMDFVKVCDMYGAGFFYIPGTETCLRIDGYVDVQYEYTDFDNDLYFTSYDLSTDGQGPTTTSLRISFDENIGEPVFLARVNFDAREETDWGTLRSYIRLEGEGTNEGGATITAKDLFIELGGLSTGYRTTALETGGLLGLMLDGYFGGGRRMYMNYTWAGNGFAITGGVDLDDGGSLDTWNVNGIDIGTTSGNKPPFNSSEPRFGFSHDFSDGDYNGGGGDSQSVNPYIVASYTGSMFTVRGKYGYDESAGKSHYGVDGSATFWSTFTVRGYWEGNEGVNEYGYSGDYLSYFPGVDFIDGSDNTDSSPDRSNPRDSYDLYADDTWGVGVVWQALPNVSVAGGYSQSSFHKPSSSARIDDLESWIIGVDWTPVDNLVVRMNYRHQEWGVEDSSVEADEFRVRIRRTF